MKVHIKGPITAERLATALDAVSVKFGDNFGGFYGAYFYLNCFTPEGLPIELRDSDDNDIVIFFGVPDGELERPVMTKEGARKKVAQNKTTVEYKDMIAARRYKESEEQRRGWAETKQKREQAEAVIQALNALSAKVLEARPEVFVEDLNKVVQAVWDELTPIYPNGKEKGNPRPMPWFQCMNGTLLLHRDSSGVHSRKIKNPVYPKTAYRNEFDHYWAHPAWLEVEKRMYKLMLKEQESLENSVDIVEGGTPES